MKGKDNKKAKRPFKNVIVGMTKRAADSFRTVFSSKGKKSNNGGTPRKSNF